MPDNQFAADELRKKFLSFFESKGHHVVSSDSLVPKDDPTILFTSAGMNQFKDYFLGRRKDLKRAASCQKCLRTADLDNVGKTSFHHSFFEMLGNFSFGDYFKEEAIIWAWEFLTKVLGLKEEDLWVSIYQDDDEAGKIWRDKMNVPEAKIIKFGAKDNFWPSNAPLEGPNGPCGPCSEIYVDRGKEFYCKNPDCKPGCGCGRYVEVWNLVFTQFNRVGVHQLEPLPNRNIDTGMGIERLACIMQKQATNFETDIFRPVVGAIIESLKDADKRACAHLEAEPRVDALRRACAGKEGRPHLNAIADHIRAAAFCISDGVLPANTGRGYVLKLLIRRSLVHAKLLGVEGPFLFKLVDSVARAMNNAYPEIAARKENISLIIKSEEEKFFLINENIRADLENLIGVLKRGGKDTIPGDKVFYFHDTRGLPIELMRDFAAEENLKLDLDGYENLMKEQRRRSRGATKISGDIFAATLTAAVVSSGVKTGFVGYERLESEAVIKAIIKDNKLESGVKGPADFAVIMDTSPFYGESGGQVGDTGVLEAGSLKIEVYDTKLIEKTPLHLCRLKEGSLKLNDRVNARVDVARRQAIARHHTATHLLQAALRIVLGPHVQQSGSFVSPERLRFDFTHFKAVDKEQLSRIEEIVNGFVLQDISLDIKTMGLEEAKGCGATALFGEKYDNIVRVVSIGGVSKELCGGTHLKATGQIGLFKITEEESVAAGLRRIEAVAGDVAYKRTRREEEILGDLAVCLNVEPSRLPAQIDRLLSQLKELERKIKNYETGDIKEKVKELVSAKEMMDNIAVVINKMDSMGADTMVNLTDGIKAVLSQNAVSVLGSSFEDKAYLVAGVTGDLVQKGFNAKTIIEKISKMIGGRGGGRPDLAQAGGNDPSGLEGALKAARDAVKEFIK